MNTNLQIIKESQHLIKTASGELCNAYNELCGGPCADVIMSVLDGELRMAEKLAQLEAFFSPQSGENYASEFEIQEIKNIES